MKNYNKVIIYISLFTCVICTYKSVFSETEKPADIFFTWEPVPIAIQYTIKIKDINNKQVFERSTAQNSITATLPGGLYRMQMIITRNNDQTLKQSDWLKFSVNNGDLSLSPKNLTVSTTKEKGWRTALLSWEKPTPKNEKTMMYKLYANVNNKTLIYTGMTGYITIIQKTESIKSYRVYLIKDKKFKYLGDTADTSYQVEGLFQDEQYSFHVSSVNGRGEESFKSNVELFQAMDDVDFGIRGCAIIPTNKFYRKLLPGGGGLLSVTKRNAFVSNLNFGVEAGFWYASGNSKDYDSSYVAPVFATMSYGFRITDKAKFLPVVSAGMGVHTVNYTKYYNGSAFTDTFVLPLVSAGFLFNVDISRRVYLKAGVEYGAFFENANVLDFALVGVTVGVRF